MLSMQPVLQWKFGRIWDKVTKKIRFWNYRGTFGIKASIEKGRCFRASGQNNLFQRKMAKFERIIYTIAMIAIILIFISLL